MKVRFAKITLVIGLKTIQENRIESREAGIVTYFV